MYPGALKLSACALPVKTADLHPHWETRDLRSEGYHNASRTAPACSLLGGNVYNQQSLVTRLPLLRHFVGAMFISPRKLRVRYATISLWAFVTVIWKERNNFAAKSLIYTSSSYELKQQKRTSLTLPCTYFVSVCFVHSKHRADTAAGHLLEGAHKAWLCWNRVSPAECLRSPWLIHVLNVLDDKWRLVRSGAFTHMPNSAPRIPSSQINALHGDHNGT